MLTVLETVGKHGPISAAEVARITSLNRTVVHRLLVTLAQRAYIRRDENGYELGPAVTSLARHVENDIAHLARPWMEKLASETGETVVLHGFDNGEAMVLDQALGQRHLVRVQHSPGSRHPLYLGASGWSILAFLDPKIQARVARRAAPGIDVAERIARVREDGYAVTHDELQLGVHGLAAPLLRRDGSCFASIGILIPSVRSKAMLELVDPLLSAAKAISLQLS